MSAIMEFIPVTDPATLEYIGKLGVGDIMYQLGVAKFIIVALYLWPRTSTVGFVLMIGWYGGALATNITHQFPMTDYGPIYVVFLLMTIDAWLRKPELLARLKGQMN